MTSPQNPAALVATSGPSIAFDPQNWGPMLELPCELTLDLLVPKFTVGDLLRLQPGAVLETAWANGNDVPVRVNGELIAWAEFEVLGNRLAVRLTEWA